MPDKSIAEELQLCPLSDMPQFLDWMNKLHTLQQQLDA